MTALALIAIACSGPTRTDVDACLPDDDVSGFLGAAVVARPQLLSDTSSTCEYYIRAKPETGARIRVVHGSSAASELFDSVKRPEDVPVPEMRGSATWYEPFSVLHVLDRELYVSVQLRLPEKKDADRRLIAMKIATRTIEVLRTPATPSRSSS
jgi:hypothetical protein